MGGFKFWVARRKESLSSFVVQFFMFWEKIIKKSLPVSGSDSKFAFILRFQKFLLEAFFITALLIIIPILFFLIGPFFIFKTKKGVVIVRYPRE